jgi:hypothetical protein
MTCTKAELGALQSVTPEPDQLHAPARRVTVAWACHGAG